MPRRKLFAYTLMFAAGITAGYFMLEKENAAGSLLFTVSLLAAARFAVPEVFSRRSACAAAAFMLAGIIIFAMRFHLYGSIESECLESGASYLSGRVLDARADGEDLVVTLMCRDGSGRRYKVRAVGYDHFSRADDGEDASGESPPYCLAGSVVKCAGEFREIYAADDPGCFDQRLYMRSRSVPVSFRIRELTVTEEAGGIINKIKRELYEARENFLGSFDEETSGFLRGVVFGDKSEIDEKTLNEFDQNSTGHILAVSGLHMGFLYGLLRALTGRRRTAGISLLIIAVTIMYGEMTLWSAATVRSCMVMAISLLSVHLKRPFDLLTSVSLAALIILAREPYQLFSSGFQMSFLAMAGMAFFIRPVSSVTGEALGVMIAVQLGTMPVIAYTFYRINPLAIFINIPVILLASVLVPVSIITLMARLMTGIIPSAAVSLTDLISYAIVRLNSLLNLGGSFSIQTAGHGGAAVVILYAVLLFMASEWTRVRLLRRDALGIAKKAALLLIPAVMLASCMYDTISDDEVVFVAVGQGDCTHIRCGGKNVLIDGGGQTAFGSGDEDDKADESYNVGEKILMPYLLHEGAGRVEIALVTHLHADHYKGIAELAEVYPVGRIGIPIDYRGSDLSIFADDEGAADPSKVMYMKPGSKVILSSDVSMEVIWPVEISCEPLAADDPNEHNTVYMIDYKGTRIMVTGDLLEEDEHEMVEYYSGTDKLDCDVLKVAHHGSKSSSCEEFLDAASPQIAVLQCGRNNIYGHPHAETLEKLEERGVKVYRTDVNGAVGIDIHKHRLSVDLYRHK